MAHQASRWQIAAAGTAFDPSTGFAATVFDSGADPVNLTTFPDAGPLDPGTPHEASVQYQSDTGDWSEWAAPAAFSTVAEVAATGVASLPALLGSGAASVEIEATGAAPLPALRGSGTIGAISAVRASATALLPALAASGAAAVEIEAAAAAALPGLLGCGQSRVQVLGSGAAVLPRLSAGGVVVVPVGAAGAILLPALRGSGVLSEKESVGYLIAGRIRMRTALSVSASTRPALSATLTRRP